MRSLWGDIISERATFYSTSFPLFIQQGCFNIHYLQECYIKTDLKNLLQNHNFVLRES